MDSSGYQFNNRYFLDLSYFILVKIIWVALIIGLMSNQLKQTEDDKSSKKEVKHQFCVLCGEYRQPETSTQNWYLHKENHQLMNYIYFSMHLEKREHSECNQIEKYVKECIQNRNYRFFPSCTAKN